MDVLDTWLAEAAAALKIDPGAVQRDLLLDLTRDVAHDVARPAAPLTAFLVGLAAGKAGGSEADVRQAVATLLQTLALRSADGSESPAEIRTTGRRVVMRPIL
jgi:hypothetical protein